MKNTKLQKYGPALGMLLGAASVIAVLALLVLVPTSPTMAADSPVVLFSIATSDPLTMVAEGELDPAWDVVGLPVTVYAVFIAGSFALAMGLIMLLSRLKGRSLLRGTSLALLCGVLAFIGARLVYCVTNAGGIANEMSGEYGIDENTSFGLLLGNWLTFLVQPWRGGYSMYGAIFGAALGAVIFSRVARHRFAETMDVIVPGVLLMLAVGRVAEQFTLQGMSRWSVSDAMKMLPFYSEENYALSVYAYEALAAAGALVACVVLLCLRAPSGRTAETGLAVISVLQVMLDAWREDDFIRFGFVRLNMILAAVVAAFVLVLRIVRSVRQHPGTFTLVWSIVRSVLFLVSAGAVMIVEFGLDGKMGITASYGELYVIQVLAILVMGASVLVQDGRKAQTRQIV